MARQMRLGSSRLRELVETSSLGTFLVSLDDVLGKYPRGIISLFALETAAARPNVTFLSLSFSGLAHSIKPKTLF